MNVPAGLFLEPLCASDDLVAWYCRGESDRLVVSFTGIGARSQPVPAPEFVRSGTMNGLHHGLFLSDPARLWLNGAGQIARIAALIARVQSDCFASHVVTLGHSMGGFAALVLPGYLPVRTALAFAPQYAVHPEIAGDDPRWRRHRRAIPNHLMRGALDRLSPETGYYVVHGDAPAEAPQRDRFPQADNLMHMILPRMGHQLPGRLKRMGKLHRIVRAGLNDRPRRWRQMLEDLGGTRRDLSKFPHRAASGTSSALSPMGSAPPG